MTARKIQLPKSLCEQIQAGQVVLFLGSGLNRGITNEKGKGLPSEQELQASLVARFLEKGFVGTSLAQVVDLAIYKSGLFAVQSHIADLLSDYQPAKSHERLSALTWTAIFTTNIDRVIEKIYANAVNPIQNLIVFTKGNERIDSAINSKSDLPCFNLYGSINHINDPGTPLILSHEQLPLNLGSRSLMFDRLETYAYDHSVIFVLGDAGSPGSRSILQRMARFLDARPRSYLLVDSMSETEQAYWNSRKFDCIIGSFEDFIDTVNREIPQHTRALSLLIEGLEHPIERRFTVSSSIKPSKSLIEFLDHDADYLYKGMKTENCEPQAFYKGYFSNWGPIERNLDVKRTMLDDVILGVLLNEEQEASQNPHLYLIKGHAGSGKTVFSHRLAWETTHQFDRICIYMKTARRPTYQPLLELYNLCKQRIYLFIDDILEAEDEIGALLTQARKDKLAITIIGTTRTNAWNDYGSDLDSVVTNSYELSYLSEKEIAFLIGLLRQHHSLGYLAELSTEEQKEALSKRAGRQLLVALHEATLGKPFREIVKDEYDSISNAQAQSLYLTVCILHRLGTETRAGLIARIHHIPFSLFREKLFKPLESIVFVQETQYTRDFVYRSRHQHIAEIVFEAILTDQRERYDEYVRLISNIDIGYQADRDALHGLISAKQLRLLFEEDSLITSIYELAGNRFPDEYHIHQQQAVFEMKRQNGDLVKAEALLKTAMQKAPRNPILTHSLAELHLKRAERSKTYAEKKKFRAESRQAVANLVGKDRTSHPYHTLLKISIDELQELLLEGDDLSINRKIKEIEKRISEALQEFPGDQYLLESESRFRQILNDNPKALAALQKAFQENKKSAFIAARLAKMYAYGKDINKAIITIKECIDENPYDKDLHYQLATLLIHHQQGTSAEILHSLRHSFTLGDSRYDAHLLCARELFITGDVASSLEIFNVLKKSEIDSRLKRRPQAAITDLNGALRFTGVVTMKEESHGYILRDKYGDRIYYSSEFAPEIELRDRVEFEIKFNFFGPIATVIRKTR